MLDHHLTAEIVPRTGSKAVLLERTVAELSLAHTHENVLTNNKPSGCGGVFGGLDGGCAYSSHIPWISRKQFDHE